MGCCGGESNTNTATARHKNDISAPRSVLRSLRARSRLDGCSISRFCAWAKCLRSSSSSLFSAALLLCCCYCSSAPCVLSRRVTNIYEYIIFIEFAICANWWQRQPDGPCTVCPPHRGADQSAGTKRANERTSKMVHLVRMRDNRTAIVSNNACHIKTFCSFNGHDVTKPADSVIRHSRDHDAFAAQSHAARSDMVLTQQYLCGSLYMRSYNPYTSSSASS